MKLQFEVEDVKYYLLLLVFSFQFTTKALSHHVYSDGEFVMHTGKEN
jgi:hypothetical protein